MKQISTFLTKNQELLWIGQELNPESPMYNMVMTYEIEGSISFPHFKKAFHKIVENSDALKSVFKYKEEPLQVYLNSIEYTIEFKDFSNTEDPKKTYKLWEQERIQQLFDLEKCLFDCALIKIEENRFIWYLNQHHLITDGWSNGLLFEKVSSYYTKALQNDLEEPEALSKFQDFAVYAEQQKGNEKLSETKKYWNKKLEQFPEAPSLYNNLLNKLSTNSKRLSISLGKERSQKIREFANKKGVRVWTLDLTLYNIFLTSLFAYFYRITDQESLVIGSPTHNRISKDFQKIIGFFVEVFPLYTKISEKETFSSLLKKIQIESNSFLQNSQTGASSSQVNRNFNVFFNYMMNTQNGPFNGFPVKTNWVHSGHTDPRHHLRLHVHDFDNTGEIHLYLDLNTSVFNDDKLKEAPQHFLNILDSFIQNIDQEINTVDLITETEISRIEQWNATKVDFNQNETLLSKFTSQAKKNPNAIALVFENNEITYKQLDEKSNQIAHFLLQKGIKKGDIIAVSFERCLEMMYYIYGIVKAGAVYLPIDTLTPEERFLFILEDAQAKIFFYNHTRISENILNKYNGFHTTNLDSKLSLEKNSATQITAKPEDLAYIIYTSGSTGMPKGVKCHHKGICNRLSWMSKDYTISEKEVFLQKTPITFDVSVWELFWPLQVGAKLVIESPEGHKNPEKLIQSIQKNGVTHIHFVPSMLAIFSETEGIENCSSIKRIFSSGEALSLSTIEKTYKKLNAQIHNLYGPTEASVDVTNWYCDPKEITNGIPIGRPVANTQLYILDKNLNQLPIGLAGELHIAGVQVAQGYLNRKELTEEKFISNIFSEDPSDKMYKTGDLAKYREDGTIEYLGRIDHQVKIHGLRVELGEIEKAIETIDQISQAVVSVDHQNNLIAYYTGGIIDESEILTLLQAKLPQHMQPSFFVHLNEFEYLSSGKVNRKNLPKPLKIKTKKKYITPSNEFEELVAEVWQEVLQLEKISITDNFIRLGGNSLNAISITSRIKKALELEVSITDIFNYPTIKAYSKNIEKTITQLMSEM